MGLSIHGRFFHRCPLSNHIILLFYLIVQNQAGRINSDHLHSCRDCYEMLGRFPRSFVVSHATSIFPYRSVRSMKTLKGSITTFSISLSSLLIALWRKSRSYSDIQNNSFLVALLVLPVYLSLDNSLSLPLPWDSGKMTLLRSFSVALNDPLPHRV